MPWRETCVVDERVRFIAALREAEEPFAVICKRFEISRKTGYKWLARYEESGPGALVDGEPLPRRCPHATPSAVVDAVIEARKAHPFWGPKKLRSWLSEREPTLTLPAASTIGTLLLRHGLIRPRRRRPREPLTGTALTQCDRPNAVWSVDSKGHFGLGDGTRCHPLTVSDGFSRYLLRCEALSEPVRSPCACNSNESFASSDCLRAFAPTTGLPSQRSRLQGSRPCRSGGSTRHHPRADRARPSGAEWAARANAPDAQSRGDTPRIARSRGSAARLRSLSQGI